MTAKKAAGGDERETRVVVVGRKQVEIVELSFIESQAVDKYVQTDEETGMPVIMSLSKIYALGAVRSVDGVKVNACGGDLAFRQVAQMFSAMEGIALAGAYGREFGKPETGEALKNESSDPA